MLRAMSAVSLVKRDDRCKQCEALGAPYALGKQYVSAKSAVSNVMR